MRLLAVLRGCARGFEGMFWVCERMFHFLLFLFSLLPPCSVGGFMGGGKRRSMRLEAVNLRVV